MLADYLQILKRAEERSNPPEVQADLDLGRERIRECARAIQEVKARADEEIQALIHQYRERRAKDHAHAGDHAGQ